MAMPVLATRRRGRTPVRIIRDATLSIKSQEGECWIARPMANAGFVHLAEDCREGSQGGRSRNFPRLKSTPATGMGQIGVTTSGDGGMTLSNTASTPRTKVQA